MTSIGTAVGFVLLKIMDIKSSEIEGMLVDQNTLLIGWLRVIVITLSSIGLLLNVWAIYMVYDYKKARDVLDVRAAEIERRIADILNEKFGFLSKFHKINSSAPWKIGTYLVVAPIMFMFFVPWILIIFASR
jgi:hypothetical protein